MVLSWSDSMETAWVSLNADRVKRISVKNVPDWASPWNRIGMMRDLQIACNLRQHNRPLKSPIFCPWCHNYITFDEKTMPTMRSYLEVTYQAQGSQEEEEELYNHYMLLLQYITTIYNSF